MRLFAFYTLLLTLLGACQGLQAGLEYQYRYNGRVSATLPHLKQLVATAGIQADITLQVTQGGRTILKLSDVRVGSFHDQIPCDPSAPIPLEWEPLHTVTLQLPFIVHYNESGPGYLDTPEEPAWITNIRKAVANVFNIAPLQGHHSVTPGFMVVEENMAGTCNTWYMLLKMPQYQASLARQRQEATIEEDVQSEAATSASYTAKTSGRGRKQRPGSKTGRKTSSRKTSGSYSSAGPDLKQDLWTLTRSVDFPTCKGGFSMRVNGGKDSGETIDQNSGGRYLLKGESGAWRLEQAVVEGAISVFTGGDHTNHVTTFTNQTLELVAVRVIRTELTPEYTPHRHYSFHYQPDHLSGHDQQGHERRPSLEEALTGVPMTHQNIIDAQALIIKSIQAIATSIPVGELRNITLVKHFTTAVDLMSHLTLQEIEAVISKFPTDDMTLYQHMKYVVYMVVISTGTEPGVEFILQKMNQERFPPEAISSFFIEAANIVKNPALIPRIIDAALAIPWGGREEPHKITALLNTAKLVNKMCLSPERKETTSYNSCDTNHTCIPHTVLSSLLPTLTQAVQDTAAPEWQRLVNLETLCILGTPSIIPVVKDVILGVGHPTRSMRMNAIFCLSSMNMPKTAYLSIVNILTPVLENVVEVPEVRNLAILVMITWAPSQQWWTRMAMSTWHEPSTQVANFITSILTTVAHMSHLTAPASELAGRAVHLAKPSHKASTTYSASVFLQEFLHNCQTSDDVRFAWLSTTQDVFPAAVLQHLQFDGFFGKRHDIMMKIYQHGLQEIKKKLRSYSTKGDTENIQLVLEMFLQLKEDLQLNQEKEVTDQLLWLMIDNELLLKATFTPEVGNNSGGQLTNILKYHRDLESTFVLPTDMGLPLVIKYTDDSIRQRTLDQSGNSNRPQGLTTNVYIQHGGTSHFEMKTLVPWKSGSTVAAGLVNTHSITLKFKIHGVMSTSQRAIEVSLTPVTQDKVNIEEHHNFPYTSVSSLYLPDVDDERSGKQTVWHHHIREEGEVLPVAAGISLHYQWHADFKLPQGRLAFLREVSLSTPRYKNWNYIVSLAPQDSSTKELLFTFLIPLKTRPEPLVETPPEWEDMDQESQRASDYDYMSQVSQSASRDYEVFYQVPGQEVEGEQETGRYAKMQQQVALGGQVTTVGVTLELRSHHGPGKKYEALLTWTGSLDQTITRVLLSLAQLPPTGSQDDPSVTCFDLSINRPVFPPHSLHMEPTQFHKTFSLKVERGASCNSDSPVMQIQADLDVSQESLNHVMEELSAECQNGDEVRPIDVYTSPVYDQLSLHATWTQACPALLLNLIQYGDDRLRAWLDPIITYDHTVTNPALNVIINATKEVESGEWRVRTQHPNGVSLVEHLKVPSLIKQTIVPAPLMTAINFNLVKGHFKTACVIDTEQVRTYDGRRYTFQPSSCWSTTTIDYGNHDPTEVEPTELSVQVRFSNNWEVRVVYPWSGRFIEFTRSHIVLNGEELSGTQDGLEYFIDGGRMVVQATNTLTIEVSDKVIIRLSNNHYNNVTGLCGNYDGEPDNDLKGPQDCLYTDPELFSHAWTTAGQGCNRFTLNRQKTKVTQYQESCPRHFYQPTAVTQPNSTVTCNDWEYEERTHRGLQCRALVQTPTCRPGCVPAFVIDKLIKYECSSEAPNVEDAQCHTLVLPTTFPSTCINTT